MAWYLVSYTLLFKKELQKFFDFSDYEVFLS